MKGATMKKSLLLTVFIVGCGNELPVGQLEPEVLVPISNPVTNAPQPTLTVMNTAVLVTTRIPIQEPASQGFTCSTDAVQTDFSGRLFTLELGIGRSLGDFTGQNEAVVSVSARGLGDGGLSFGSVFESSPIVVSMTSDEFDGLIIHYWPTASEPSSSQSPNLDSFFLEHETTIRLEASGDGLYLGTLNNFSKFELPISCWRTNQPRKYSYNSDTGLCQNEQGELGLNASHVFKVRKTKDGQCVDMSGWSLNGQDYSYPNLDWDVQGANLNGATIHFANMIDADFRGAQMQNFTFGYTNLKGQVDEHTQLPQDCSAEGGQIDCVR